MMLSDSLYVGTMMIVFIGAGAILAYPWRCRTRGASSIANEPLFSRRDCSPCPNDPGNAGHSTRRANPPAQSNQLSRPSAHLALHYNPLMTDRHQQVHDPLVLTADPDG